MKQQKNVKGIMSSNSLTNYPYYRIDGGSMSGETYLLTYTHATGSTIGSTAIVSYPTGVTSSATVVNDGDTATVTTDTYLLVKLVPGQTATINGYVVANIGGDFYFNGTKYDIGDTFDYDGLTFTFIGFGSFLLGVVDTDSSAVTSFTMVPSSAATHTVGDSITLVMYDQNSVDITGLIALSGDTTTSTYTDSWTPTTGELVLSNVTGNTVSIYFYYITDATINDKYVINFIDPVVSSMTLVPTSGSYESGTTETLVFTNQSGIDITTNVSLSSDTYSSAYVTDFSASTGAIYFGDKFGIDVPLTFYYNGDDSLTSTFTAGISGLTSITVTPTGGTSHVTGTTTVLAFTDQNGNAVDSLDITLSGDTSAYGVYVPSTSTIRYDKEGVMIDFVFYHNSDDTITSTYTVDIFF